MNIFEHIDKRVAIGFAVILVAVAGGFFYWMSDTGAKDTLLTVLPTSPLDATLGRDILIALATLKSTRLDTSVFEDPVFTKLKDFSVDIPAQPVGRERPDNPFATFKGQQPEKAPAKKGTSSQPELPSKPTPKPQAPVDQGFDIN